MSLERILSISGKPGLYELKVQTRTGFLAESLIDGKKITVGMRSNVSLLSEISVYTYEGERPLVEIFKMIAEKEDNGLATVNKDNKADLEAYFETVLPQFDRDRVYASDIKKIISWYNMLAEKGIVTKDMEIKRRTSQEEVAE